MNRSAVRGLLLFLLTLPMLLMGNPTAQAHPLGNATVNHYDGLHLYPDRITDTAAVDIAEIPTYQRRAAIDTNGDGVRSSVELRAYADRQCDSLAKGLAVQVGGRALPMRVLSSGYAERPGAVGLITGRLDCSLGGQADLTRKSRVQFANNVDGQGIGWHEITVAATGVTIKNSVFPATSISKELRAYPNDLLSSPLDIRSGTLDVQPGAGGSTYALTKRLPVAGPAVRALNDLASTFNRTAGAEHLTVGVGLLAVLLSVLLGAGHAFLPGHGKTIMAAYLVGRRGRLRDVVTVGATVTLTHTLGVLILGLAITTTASFAPTAAEQYLGIVSGLIVAAVGVGLLVSAVRRHGRPVLSTALAQPSPVEALTVYGAVRGPFEVTSVAVGGGAQTAVLAPTRPGHHDHDHTHGHRGADGDDDGGQHQHHKHAHADALVQASTSSGFHRHGFERSHSHAPDAGFSKGGLVGLGVAGGLVPSPSALLVLLAATALGRTVFGVVLVLGYGLGMAAALSAAGLLLVKVRGRLDRYANHPRLAGADRLLAALPVLTAVLVLTVGVGLTLRAAGGSV